MWEKAASAELSENRPFNSSCGRGTNAQLQPFEIYTEKFGEVSREMLATKVRCFGKLPNFANTRHSHDYASYSIR